MGGTFSLSLAKWARSSSPWLLHFNAGACNGCDIEVLSAICPNYDPERVGVLLKPSPRHADVLVVTGIVTNQTKDRLIRIYEQMPEPKAVVAVGTCAISGGVFHDAYNRAGSVKDFVPVLIEVPGCPPRPEKIVEALAIAASKLREV